MAHKFSLLNEVLLRLAMLWLIVSPVVVLWDAFFVLLRPWTLPGGPLHWFWKPCMSTKLMHVAIELVEEHVFTYRVNMQERPHNSDG